MKRLVWLFAITLFVIPAFAQDEGFSSPDAPDDFFSGDAFDAPAQSGGPRIDPLLDLRSWLAKANASPLDKKQEKPLNKLYDKEVKAMARSFEMKFGVPLESAIASQNPGRGRRGGNFNRVTPEQTLEVRRLSQQLVNKIIAALRIDQQRALRQYQSEQLRIKRLELIMQSMDSVGLPLTPEQRTQVEALFARESRLRTLIIVEAKGQPHGEQVAKLETQTTQRVVRLLDQPQKAALTEAMARSKAR